MIGAKIKKDTLCSLPLVRVIQSRENTLCGCPFVKVRAQKDKNSLCGWRLVRVRELEKNTLCGRPLVELGKNIEYALCGWPLVRVIAKIVSMIRKYHNHKPQTTPWHCGEEPLNQHATSGRQIKQSNQLSLPHQWTGLGLQF